MRVYPRCFLCLLVLLGSCQSSRSAFYFGFRPAPRPPASVAASDSAVVERPVSAVASQQPKTAPLAAAPTISRRAAPKPPRPIAAPPLLERPTRSTAGQRHQAAPRSSHVWRTTARAYSVNQSLLPLRPAVSTDELFFLGGLALVGIGLAVGLIIGGWPGLLSGLALGVPGYLFLGRGYAGSWNSAARPLRTSTRVAAAHPADGIDALGRFLVKVTVAVASVFLATLVLGLIFGSSAAAVIGGTGLALVAVLALVLLNA